jgi:hypothetical protein
VIRALGALAFLLAITACTIGIGVTNAPVIRECIPGSATKPCP